MFLPRAVPAPPSLSQRLLAWYEQHGRKDLPWQHPATPYRVWVSEIMLQQTQVQTVIPYFERFMMHFPDVEALAGARLDEVLHEWSGLGYYARARNLHRAAGVIADERGGVLPETLEEWVALPGIGRSTAAAILALSRGQRHAILDGNVKRVLCRYHALEGWPGSAAVTRRLWALADAHTPDEQVAAYTQAIMDLGATVCTRAQPNCAACPLAADCLALAEGRESELPEPRPKRATPIRRTLFVIVCDALGRVLLERRPSSGVWGGLWSFPEAEPGTDLAAWCRLELGAEADEIKPLKRLRHAFTHFRLDIEPMLVRISVPPSVLRDEEDRCWYDRGVPEALGLATPVSRLLSELEPLIER